MKFQNKKSQKIKIIQKDELLISEINILDVLYL